MVTARAINSFLMLGLLLCGCCSYAQNSLRNGLGTSLASPSDRDTKEPQSAPLSKKQGNEVMPNDVVITIHGLCSSDVIKTHTKSSLCTTEVTRHEFDSLLNAANVSGQQVSSTARENFARGYVLYLAFERAARNAGFEDSAQFAEYMKWARLRAIMDAYRGHLVEQARVATQAEVDAYYRDHIALYDRIEVTRITIPRVRPNGSTDQKFDNKARQTADAARDRMVRGEVPGKIQKDIYAALGLPGVPPVDVETRGRANFGQEESNELFALKVGQVSGVQQEDGYYAIYKVTSHHPLDKSNVQDQIVRSIAEEKIKKDFQSIENSVHSEYNAKYFGTAPVQQSLISH